MKTRLISKGFTLWGYSGRLLLRRFSEIGTGSEELTGKSLAACSTLSFPSSSSWWCGVNSRFTPPCRVNSPASSLCRSRAGVRLPRLGFGSCLALLKVSYDHKGERSTSPAPSFKLVIRSRCRDDEKTRVPRPEEIIGDPALFASRGDSQAF